MALPGNTVWEVRASGTGVSDNNGGGFVPGASGTDWSQQNAPQYALTGIASAGSGNTILSAAAATDMVGNIAQAISGTNINAGFYEVVSVVAGVSITFSTNNAAASICSGVAASGVINIGGALLTIGKALTVAQSSTAQANTIYVKNTATFTITSQLLITQITFGQALGPMSLIGYTTTRGDNGQAVITTSTNSVDIFGLNAAVGIVIANFSISTTAGTKGHGVHTLNSPTSARTAAICLDNVLINGCQIGIKADFTENWEIAQLILNNCEIKSCVSHGVSQSGATSVSGCYIHDNGGSGYINSKGSSPVTGLCSFDSTVFYNNTASGIENAINVGPSGFEFTWLSVTNCAFVNNGVDGIKWSSGSNSAVMVLENCIFYGQTAWGLEFSEIPCAFVSKNNAFGNNTSGAHTGWPTGQNEVTLTADPFTSKSTGDFSLNSTAGGGAACKGAGFPGVLAGGLSTGHLDIGAIQSAGGGGSSGMLFVPNLEGT